MLDPQFCRRQFPALEDSWALLDNAGGTVVTRRVIEGVHEYMSRFGVQLGASYERSTEAAERVAAGRKSVARLLNADPAEVVLGPSMTVCTQTLARALGAGMSAGDEIVVTNVDHEANIGPWRALESRGVVVREWKLRPESATLEIDDLETLLNDRTRLVCVTHVSNILGAIHDVARIADVVHGAGAKIMVDGVAFAPHRRVDVAALGVDFYAASLYKICGPHLGMIYGRGEALREAEGQNHFFAQELPRKLEPGGVSHELCAGLPGILDYIAAVDAEHFVSAPAGPAAQLDRVFDLFAAHEQSLCEKLMGYLQAKSGVRILGPLGSAADERVATVSFVVEGRKSSEVPPLLESHQIAVRWGHFYAYRLVRDLGLLETDGVVRVSMVHYNTEAEVDRLITALDTIL